MKVEVEVISNGIIKPSSPTPDHLRHYRLSYLDQVSPKTYNPLVLFYELNNGKDESNITEISNQIKKSLSEVLTLYYPLAGRVKNDRVVDCNDEGISYSEARVNSALRLTDAVKNPNPSELAKFLPFELHEVNEFLIGVRLNIFVDRGIAIGVCISHQLADALSCIAFVKSWGAVSRGDHAEKPQFIAAKLFPPKDDLDFDASAGVTKMVVSRRFVFEASTIEAIRSKYDEKLCSEHQRRPTRVEALSAFIWSRFTAANSKEHIEGPEKVYALLHPVNIRRKLEPPLPENSFGNLSRCAITMFPARTSLASLDNGEEYYDCEMVKRIRESIMNVDMNYLKKVQELREDENMEFLKEESKRLVMRGGQVIAFSFTSLCRFPLYDADLGWGEPLWVSSATLTFSNVVVFMDSKMGNAIEAYIGLKEEHMAKLEADEEFLKSVSPN